MSDPSITRVGQIALVVHDLPRAVAFYRDVLGLPLLFEFPPKLAFFGCGGVRLMLTLPEQAEFDHPASVVYYVVSDIHASAAAVKARGATLEGEPHLVAKLPDHELWMCFLRDPDRNLLALMSEVR